MLDFKKIFLLGFSLATLFLWPLLSKAVCSDCLSFQVQAPIPLLWTGGIVPFHVPDNLFVTLKFPDHFKGYVAGSKHTYSFLPSNNLLGLNQHTFNSSAVIEPGSVGS
ncbi:MAG: hypothetical protein V3574_03950, partial [Candidatus Moraniibacteriota bacterium]